MKKSLAVLAAAAIAATAFVAVPAMGAGPSKTVGVVDFKFTPKKLTVKPGTRITWKWGGRIIHNVVLKKGPKGVKKFSSKLQTKGTYAQTLRTTGTYSIICTIHEGQGMVMSVTVIFMPWPTWIVHTSL